jgi:preprotein translocase subunit SecF
MYNIVGKTKYISAVSIIAIVVSLGLWGWSYTSQIQQGVTDHYGFNLGIDFTGGSSLEVVFEDPSKRPSVVDATQRLQQQGVNPSIVQTVGDDGLSIKVQQSDDTLRQKIVDTFAVDGGKEESYSSVGPTLGKELQRKALGATGIVILGIVLYISYAFRQMNRGPVPSWVFGLGAIVALLHDIIIVLGIYVVLGMVWNVQIDSLFVTALLTVLGFSIHDTIVVYDRIREGLKQRKKHTFEEIVNRSINSTMARSINTSLTTLFVLTALYLFGGVSIQYFVLALIIGIVVGTYSSIFVAIPVLIIADRIKNR